jgi:hypothetical protein
MNGSWMMICLIASLPLLAAAAADEGKPRFRPHTRLTLAGGRWRLNGQVTYPGARAEGLLMNVRMVNATFEDRNKPDFDPEANTDRFLAQLPDYVAHGVRAFTLCLQGGFPGYEGAVNSAFNPDGLLREPYLEPGTLWVRAGDRSVRRARRRRDPGLLLPPVLFICVYLRSSAVPFPIPFRVFPRLSAYSAGRSSPS